MLRSVEDLAGLAALSDREMVNDAMDSPDPATEPDIAADDEVDDLVDTAADDAQARLWLRAISASAEMLGKMPEAAVVDCRVRHAVDMALIAAAERIGRLCRSDLGA